MTTIKFIEDSSNHVTYLNRALKNIKSEIIVDFIWPDQSGITIITNKVILSLELQIIKNYIKNANCIKAEGVEVSHLPQLKLYFKIIGILYLIENTNIPIMSVVVEDIIKKNHIFNNIVLVSKPHIIKVFPKLDIAIIWLDIWDVQSRSKTKGLINGYFNVGSYIVTVRDINMNPGVLQCKNCWKWEHVTFLCRIQEAKYIKCNSLHKYEHRQHFTWCCKANHKTNPSRLETKQGELCSHSFKCLNCWGDHQADFNLCLFWKHRFNCE